ncbi:MAG: STAS domain-containing protein [Clostridia bacterium]|nr:STAS domain-containing protein [Clostridia bacterium]
MNTVVEKTDTKLVVTVGSRVDTNNAPELEKVVFDNIEGVEHLILDLKNLEYISSSGLRVILKAQKKMNTQGSMVIKNVCQDIMEIFDMTGFSEIMSIE